MLHKAVLFLVSIYLTHNFFVYNEILDFKVITAIRHGLESSLEYIDRNLYRSNVDCVLGIAFVKGFMKSAYRNGSHIMDKSTLRLINKSEKIIEKGEEIFKHDAKNGNNWKFESLVDNDMWDKPVHYKNHQLLAIWKKSNYLTPNIDIQSGLLKGQNSDVCLQEILNSTKQVHTQGVYMPCVVTTKCWKDFFQDGSGDGYYLTHKLLLLQIAKAKGCLLNNKLYDRQTKYMCSSIMFEINNAIYFGKIEEIFDLFLEQILLCGYEGYSDFIQNSWLFYILKSQNRTGCFKDVLTDKLKSRIKKDMTYFEDGCNDHTTGLGTAVLGLYYNYIVHEEKNY